MTDSQVEMDRAVTLEAGEADEISLLDLAIVLVKHKKSLVGITAAAATISVIVALLLTPIYTATTKLLLPPQQGSSTASAMLAQLGGLANLAGAAAGIKNANDLYVGMLKSRTVADSLIKRFDLLTYYDDELFSQARKTLEGMTTIAAGKDGIITIDVDDKDPQRAADIANAYGEEFSKLTNVLAVTEASQRRLFFERQLLQAKDNLTKAEIAAKQAMDSGGLANIDAQGKALLETTARLRGQIAVKNVEISAMRSFATDENPGLKLAQQELSALRTELAKLDAGHTASEGEGPTGQGLDNLALVRNVKYFETVYELIAKQFEVAKIDEAKDAAVVQVLDTAVVPDRKSKPKRALIVLLATLAGFLVAVLWAFFQEAAERARQNPQQAERLATFRRYLRWRT